MTNRCEFSSPQAESVAPPCALILDLRSPHPPLAAAASRDSGVSTVCLEGFSDAEPALLLSQWQAPLMALGPKCPACSKMYGALHGEQGARIAVSARPPAPKTM